MTRAVWFTGPRQAELRDAAVAHPGSREATVSAVVSLISSGTEMNMFRGESGIAKTSLPTAEGHLPFPLKYGYQVVGVVEEAGVDSGVETGDLVFAAHPHQERFTIAAQPSASWVPVHRLAPGYDPRRATFLNLFTVAHNALLDVPLRPGDCVSVSGLGIIGSFAAFMARRSAARLVLVDPDASRRSAADWIGADAVVEPAAAAEAVAELTEGRGVDVAIEASGAPVALQTAIELTGLEGSVAVVSDYGSRLANLRLSPAFLQKRQRMIGCFVGVPGGGPLWTRQRSLATAAGFLADVPIENLVSHELAFDRAAEAYAIVDDPAQSSLGVLLNYSPSRDA